MEYFKRFLQENNYPLSAQNALVQAYTQMTACSEMSQELCRLYEQYHTNSMEYPAANADIEAATRVTRVHPYTALLVFYIILSQELEARYITRGLSKQLFCDTMADLLYKANECFALHGVWGCAVAFWNEGFFNGTRFALGRLQYEQMPLPEACTINGIYLAKDEAALNVHIPSGSKLHKQDVEASFLSAKQFFNAEPAIFMCDSWLLHPLGREFLPAHSNILMLMDFFTIVSVKDEPTFRNAWRVFDQEAKEPYCELPQKTSIQKAYVKWLESGAPFGSALGVMIL